MERSSTDERNIDAHKYSRPRSRWPGTANWLIPIFGVIFALTSFISFRSHDPANAMRCDMAYMWPGYVSIDGPSDASGYALWLYREQGLDISDKPHGTPVLFIPGNAGSYKQVRSLASESAKQYYAAPNVPQAELYADGIRNLDWFAADFNEDFSALHSTVVQQQADYVVKAIEHILSLYAADERTNVPQPSSVILVGHSMGGIVARLAIIDPAMQPDSVRTIITLSTPHLLPPVSIDSGMERIYSRINGYWREQYARTVGQNALAEMLLVSIAGGTADIMIPSDYTAVDSFAPPTHGFTTFTMSLPSLLSAVDHQAMAWCDQLRRAVVWSLLRSTSISEDSRARALEGRLSYFRRGLLDISRGTTESDTRRSDSIRIHEGGFHWSQSASFDVPPHSPPIVYALNNGRENLIEVRLSTGSSKVYICNTDGAGLHCSLLRREHGQSLPNFDDDGIPVPMTTDSPVYFAVNQTPTMHAIAFMSNSPEQAEVVISEMPHASMDTVKLGIWQLLFSGTSVKLPAGVIHNSIALQHAANSLIVYRLFSSATEGSHAPIMARATAPHIHEAHYFSLARPARLHLHASPPFIVLSDGDRNIVLDVWKSPESEARITIRVDWYTSLGKLVLRYRGLLASWPVIFALEGLRSAQHAQLWRCMRKFTLLGIGFGVFQAGAVNIGILPNHFVACLLGTSSLLFLPLVAGLLAVAASLSQIIRSVLCVIVAVVSPVTTLFRLQQSPHTVQLNLRSRTRTITLVALLCFTSLHAPMALASTVLFLYLLNRTAAARGAPLAGPTAQLHNASVQDFELLTIAVLRVPFDLATLAIWFRKLQFGNLTAFPSDHNILSIAGLLLVIVLPRRTRVKSRGCSLSRLLSSVVFAGQIVILLAGARYTFVMPHVVNVVLCAVGLHGLVT